MKVLQRLRHLSSRAYANPHCHPHIHRRLIATHSYSHHATALSVLPSNVDTGSTEYKDNARAFGEVTARMQELHNLAEQGGPLKSRDKHIAKGKMLPRE